MSKIACPYCSTEMESYATVCPGCAAERVIVAPERLSFFRLIFITLFLSGVSLVIAAWAKEQWVLYIGIGISLLTGLASMVIPAKYEWQRF